MLLLSVGWGYNCNYCQWGVGYNCYYCQWGGVIIVLLLSVGCGL